MADNCLLYDDSSSNIKCTLHDKAYRMAIVDTLVTQSKNGCTVKDRRYAGVSQAGAMFYETSCTDGKGYLYKVDKGQLTQTYPCEKASMVMGGCELTDAKEAETAQAGLYTKLAKSAAFECDVSKYAPSPRPPVWTWWRWPARTVLTAVSASSAARASSRRSMTAPAPRGRLPLLLHQGRLGLPAGDGGPEEDGQERLRRLGHPLYRQDHQGHRLPRSRLRRRSEGLYRGIHPEPAFGGRRHRLRLLEGLQAARQRLRFQTSDKIKARGFAPRAFFFA
uniref:Uncharacterized protein n=1 Tax=Phenylobacterium glaciei TaxID=2803784 RepID=A0A974P3J2_9CAUL|nr:hypothetical protein JKL49_23975 [Phenylobacterium glaciei]